MNKILIVSVILGMLSCTGNRSKHIELPDENSLPANPRIDLQATVEDENTVEFFIKTDIPLPVEVMTSIDLKNQDSGDTYIGASKRMKIDTTPYIFDFDLSEEELPCGEYEAGVTFYPKWGAKDGNKLAQKIESKVESVYPISLSTSYGTAEDRIAKNKKQLWIMNNVAIDTDWDTNKFVNILGEYRELKVTNRNPEIIKAYYFSQAGMTIFVNKPKKAVVTWREGKVDTL
ncbi:hypothetical protein [Mangrovibacterium sp.]|uniref:hypothetical protein n=1 Tax=Mangrovibacterium sp. TaxID=1961364 RepID=UPI003564297F